MTTHFSVRPPDLARLGSDAPGSDATVQSARGQNFIVDWLAGDRGARLERYSADEAILLLPDAPARVASGEDTREAAARTVAILPAGTVEVALGAPGRAMLLRSDFTPDEAAACRNAGTYRQPDPRVGPKTAFRRLETTQPFRLLSIDDVAPASGRARLKMLQSATMSINWVEYDGPRDRTQLSPHAHDDFEQGSLAIDGAFMHHLRVPWGPDATLWRDDVHLDAPAPSLAIFPPGLIHTTEGLGEGAHLLIDIFCPARSDFRAKGWLYNADDYGD